MAGYFDGFGEYRGFCNSDEDDHQACSVVFKGITEYGSTDEAENKREDYATVMEIVRWLGIYDEIPQTQVRRSLNGTSNRRNIIVTLNSPKSRKLLLQRGRIWLRTADRLRCITIEPAVLPIELHARRQATGLARVPVGLS